MQVGLHLSSFTWPGGPNALRAVGPPEQEMLEAYTALGAQARCPAPPLRRRRPRLRGDPKDGDRPARPRPRRRTRGRVAREHASPGRARHHALSRLRSRGRLGSAPGAAGPAGHPRRGDVLDGRGDSHSRRHRTTLLAPHRDYTHRNCSESVPNASPRTPGGGLRYGTPLRTAAVPSSVGATPPAARRQCCHPSNVAHTMSAST